MQFMPDLRRGRRQIGMRNHAADAGVVDQHVQPAPHGHRLAHQPDAIGVVGQVGLHIGGRAELARQRLPHLDRIARMQDN
ncbi:hypothetical protein BGC_62890 [Burkholderia sp. 3C]